MAPSSNPTPPTAAPERVVAHRLAGARFVPSPNQDARPDPADVALVVLHGISVPPGCFGGGQVEALFCNALDPGSHPAYAELAAYRVSAHLLIERDGAVTQFVPFHRRAWHAGVSCWAGRERCNDFAIGIELEGADDLAYTEAQYARLLAVLDALRLAYPRLGAGAVVGHCDIAPGRKTDPGPAFDWARVRRHLAAWA